MSFTPASALVLGLGARIVFNVLFRPVEAGVGSSISDYVVQGLWQGALVFYVFTEHEAFASALAVGLLARCLLDFVSSNDPVKLAYTVGFALVGAICSFILTQVLEDDFTLSEEFSSFTPRRRRSSSTDVRESRDVISDRRSERSFIRRIRNPSSILRVPRGRRERERSRPRAPKFVQEVVREPSPVRRDPSSVHHAVTVTDGSSETVELYTGLGRLVDMQLSGLRKRAASAEVNRRRCKEERKWALAQGNKALATQLSWQISRYAALSESYTREADRRIIQATKDDSANANRFANGDFQVQQHMPMHESEYGHDRYDYQVMHQPPPQPQDTRYAYLDKGKMPVHNPYAGNWNMPPQMQMQGHGMAWGGR
ncbi:hypothetical protein SCHPADRAFT_901067 [Schizopora paradoxa]|uniref:Uncharacterized protein n=1 Tax=Schizopora paradoxa TaxID=27342 RepID=A0A0H2RZ84_9AGAM|nr:hypothetical protein SCHPADRAFT_901067 [Schizopora paradoxa]